MSVINKIRARAQQRPRRILLPESYDDRILQAASYLSVHNIIRPVLLGDKKQIAKDALALKIDLANVEIIENNTLDKTELQNLLKEIAIKKNKTPNYELLNNDLVVSALLLKDSQIDGVVAGAANTTKDVLRAAFSIIGTKRSIRTISGAFIMALQDKCLLFADCAVVIDPSKEQLADIAISSANNMQRLLGIVPKVAMLSFSTQGSGKHLLSDKIAAATKLVKQKNNNLIIDGEMQLDAAISKQVAAKKLTNSKLNGDANVLVFPNLDAGNIGYKLVERLANAIAVGPILQGLAQPMNDLSRGANIESIINTAAITSLQCK